MMADRKAFSGGIGPITEFRNLSGRGTFLALRTKSRNHPSRDSWKLFEVRGEKKEERKRYSSRAVMTGRRNYDKGVLTRMADLRLRHLKSKLVRTRTTIFCSAPSFSERLIFVASWYVKKYYSIPAYMYINVSQNCLALEKIIYELREKICLLSQESLIARYGFF